MSDAEGPTRRTVLVGGGAAATAVLVAMLAGCSEPPPPTPPPPPDPDDALRAAAAGRERDLLLAYDAALVADPSLATKLSPLRGHHVEHLSALIGPPPVEPGGPSASLVPSIAPPAPPAAAPPAVALATLATAERTAAARHADDAVNARDRDLAALLASLSASELSHPVALS